jgi:hypothetical protein
MSNKDVIFDLINSFGSVGIKKTDLKKKCDIDNFDALLNELTQENRILISKKGTFLYCWSKEFYFDYLINSDLKFKYLYESISNIQNKINDYSDSIFKYLENLDCQVVELKNSFNKIIEKINDPDLESQRSRELFNNVSLDEFRESFDNVLLGKSSSIGWVELSSIKNEICTTYDLSDNEFYNYVSTIVESSPEKYELSSGGYEGVVLRGIVHGFVRRI